ncbi:methyltransferase domain-containing protein [Streptomyces lunaelactis]|uniref:methyltransferase domain-containing protein n=1 Tax=Streptomyces lunaelactis TaxID=1535768 RepID=UPI001C3097A9
MQEDDHRAALPRRVVQGRWGERPAGPTRCAPASEAIGAGAHRFGKLTAAGRSPWTPGAATGCSPASSTASGAKFLECLPDPAQLLKEIWRVLRPGGRAVLSHSDFDAIVISGVPVDLTAGSATPSPTTLHRGWIALTAGSVASCPAWFTHHRLSGRMWRPW